MPVLVEVILADERFKGQAAPPLSGRKQKLHLRIVPERFVMPYAYDGLRERLLVDNASVFELRRESIALLQNGLQNLRLHLSHHGDMDLLCRLLPDHAKHRVLLLDPAKLPQCDDGVIAFGKAKPIGQDRLQARKNVPPLHSKALSHVRRRKPRHGADPPRGHFLQDLMRLAIVKSQLIGLFLTVYHLLGAKHAARHLQMGQAIPLLIPADLEHPRAEFGSIFRRQAVLYEAIQEFLYAKQAKGRAKVGGV